MNACFDERFVVVVSVRNDQDEPVYYYDYRPYVRDGSQSRPATPDEVKARILVHPGAEHKKRMEDLTYEIAKNAVEQSARRTAMADDISIRLMEQQNDMILRAGHKFIARPKNV